MPASTGLVRRPAADLDVSSVRLQGKAVSPQLRRAVLDLQQEQTLDGAGTVTLTLSDYSGALLRSKLLHGELTLTYDGIDFVMVKRSKGDRTVTITFEERAVNLLRQYDTPKKADRATTTRAQFVRTLIDEVSEARIPYRIPEVNKRQPIAPSTPAQLGWRH